MVALKPDIDHGKVTTDPAEADKLKLQFFTLARAGTPASGYSVNACLWRLRRGWQVTATARSAAAATDLVDEVAAFDGGIAVEEVDIDRPESVDALARYYAFGRTPGKSFCAAICGPSSSGGG